MRVLHINPFPPEHLGGSEIFCKNLTINLKRKNIDCNILTSDIFKRNIKTDFINQSIKVIYKKCYYNLWNKNPLVNIYSFIKKNYRNYDLIHSHSYTFLTSLQCSMFRKLRNFPLILHVHGGVQTPLNVSSNIFEYIQLILKQKIYYKYIGKFMVENSDAIISVSNKDLMIMNERYNISKKKQYYIPNGVDINKFKKNNHIKKEFITFIGRFTYIKGIDIFINVIKNLYKKNKNLRFLIIGDGPLRNIVKEAKKRFPITHFINYPYENIEKIYNMSKLIFLTSRFEGLPTILLESLACETPVVAPNVGGISEVLIPNKNGIFFDNNQFNESIKKSLNLFNDENILKEYGKNGRNLIEKRFSWDVITDKIENVYKEVIT